MKLWSGRMDLDGTCRHRCGMGGIYLCRPIGNKADMGGAAFDDALAEPEEYPTVRAETLEIGMAGRSVFAIVVDGMDDPQGR
ncbi:hypothetical protein D3C87_2023740 [compost metagenome]